MVFCHRPKERNRGSRPKREWLRTVRFLTFAVGFLTVHAFAAPVEDSLERLDRLEEERSSILVAADSLGFLIGRLPPAEEDRVAELLGDAEQLGQSSREIELEILLERQRCRSLAFQELAELRENRTGESLAREAVLLDLLDRRLDSDWGRSLVFVEPDSLDGRETLLDKQAYLADLRDRIVALRESLDRRIDQRRREESLRSASEQFADESRFLDEGGRVGADETVFLRNVPTNGEYTGEGMARYRPSGGGVEPSETVELDGTGLDGDEGSGWRSLLSTRERLVRDLDRVTGILQWTEQLLDRYESNPR